MSFNKVKAVQKQIICDTFHKFKFGHSVRLITIKKSTNPITDQQTKYLYSDFTILKYHVCVSDD